MLSALVVAVVVMGGVAYASHWQSRRDPNDTPGKLDFERSALQVPNHLHPTGNPVRCRIRLIRHVRVQTFHGRNNFFCHFDFQGRDDAQPPDAYARASFERKGGELVGRWYVRSNSGYQLVAFVPTNYERARGALTFRIPRRHLAGRDSYWRWRTLTTFKNNAACSNICRDWGPRRGRWFRYYLGGGPLP